MEKCCQSFPSLHCKEQTQGSLWGESLLLVSVLPAGESLKPPSTNDWLPSPGEPVSCRPLPAVARVSEQSQQALLGHGLRILLAGAPDRKQTRVET